MQGYVKRKTNSKQIGCCFLSPISSMIGTRPGTNIFLTSSGCAAQRLTYQEKMLEDKSRKQWFERWNPQVSFSHGIYSRLSQPKITAGKPSLINRVRTAYRTTQHKERWISKTVLCSANLMGNKGFFSCPLLSTKEKTNGRKPSRAHDGPHQPSSKLKACV